MRVGKRPLQQTKGRNQLVALRIAQPILIVAPQSHCKSYYHGFHTPGSGVIGDFCAWLGLSGLEVPIDIPGPDGQICSRERLDNYCL